MVTDFMITEKGHVTDEIQAKYSENCAKYNDNLLICDFNLMEFIKFPTISLIKKAFVLDNLTSIERFLSHITIGCSSRKMQKNNDAPSLMNIAQLSYAIKII